jgi:hypothetical protein
MIRAPTLLINAQECVERLAPQVRSFHLRRIDEKRGLELRAHAVGATA